MLRSFFSLSRLYQLIDWFVPARIRSDPPTLQRTRMFLISHLCGPFLGSTITGYLFLIGHTNIAWCVLTASILIFWAYPFVLRMTAAITPLALLSVQNLIFAILWGCYQYGGLNSPFMPWLLTVPLLAFFYLGPSLKLRLLVLLILAINLFGFFLIFGTGGFPVNIPLSRLTGIGIISTLSAAVYVSMMALYYSKIVASQSVLERKVRSEVAVARELERAKLEAERANRAKTEFLAKMSHELRTPLNAVIGYSEMLLEDMTSPGQEQQSEDLKKIHKAGKHLLDLITDILDFSKVEAGKMDVFRAPFDLAAFIDEIVAECREDIARNRNQLVLACPDEMGVVNGDKAKLRRALLNLLSNAAKFTQDGQVLLTVLHDAGRLTISVRDTGTGIAPAELPTLFQNFGETQAATESKYGGTRLGLALSQRLCRLMGGAISVESELGKGSRFVITLPLHDAVTGPLKPAAAPHLVAGALPNAARPILAIDDDPDILILVSRILERNGYSVVTAGNGSEGLRLARKIKPSLILLDVMMPETDGWQTLEAVKADPELSSCPVVLLTVSEDMKRSRILGADAHLMKPIEQESLLQTIQMKLSAGRSAGASSALV
jgi:signal transduction histidine kinase/ActR/RegA family two-component response regulator